MEFKTFFPLTDALNQMSTEIFGDHSYWAQRAQKTFDRNWLMKTLGVVVSTLLGTAAGLGLVGAFLGGMLLLFSFPGSAVPASLFAYVGLLAIMVAPMGALLGLACSGIDPSKEEPYPKGDFPAYVMDAVRLILTSPVFLGGLFLDACSMIPRAIKNVFSSGNSRHLKNNSYPYQPLSTTDPHTAEPDEVQMSDFYPGPFAASQEGLTGSPSNNGNGSKAATRKFSF
ncbi:MAG: hypothetical protein DHS20C10_03550 [marine bacterium B5-7]|nr:MAG: hypothetical protein DHS20C10_03550 [marine bacterium B5-7]